MKALKKVFGKSSDEVSSVHTKNEQRIVHNNKNSSIKTDTENEKIDPSSIVYVNFEAKRQALLKNADQQTIDVMVSVGSKDVAIDAQRVGLDLVFVIDISGSMQGEKIALVRETLLFVIGELQPMDRVSLVAFDSVAEILTGLCPMTEENKAAYKGIIESKLKERGSTNIVAGMNGAFEILLGRKEINDMTAVFLLSDGADTCGNSHASFKESLSKNDFQMQKKGMEYKINSFGYGQDHDEKALGLYSNFKEGNFYYIKNPQIVDECFIDCLGYLMSVFAKSAEATVYLSGSISFIKKYGPNWSSDNNKSKATIRIGNLAAGIEKNFIAKIQIPATLDLVSLDIGFVILSFTAKEQSFNLKTELKLSVVNAEEIGPSNQKVEQNIVRVEAAEVMEEAKQDFKEGNTKIAKVKLEKFKCEMQSITALGPTFMAQMNELCDEEELGNEKRNLVVKEMLVQQAYKPSMNNFSEGNAKQKTMISKKKAM